LSFAQFEREVTAERIRDKVAASKRKGMWMGGAVPFGYDVVGKALVVNSKEAKSLQKIFAEYLAVGSVRELSETLAKAGIVSKQRTDRHGRVTGGEPFSRGALYNILRNPIYIGKVRHKDDLHEGLHAAIIDDATWHLVQELLADHGGKAIRANRKPAKRMLVGVLFDSQTREMRTTYANKSVSQDGTTWTKRYWYYTSTARDSGDASAIERLPANEIERVVLEGLAKHLSNARWLSDQMKRHAIDPAVVADILRAVDLGRIGVDGSDATAQSHPILRVVTQIEAQKDRILVSVDLAALLAQDVSSDLILAQLEIPFQKRQNGRAKPIVIASQDAAQREPDLVALIADARRWASELVEGKSLSIQHITEREDLRSGFISRILPPAWLAPDITTAILEGRQPNHRSAKTLRELPDLPLDWAQQRQILGFAHA